MRCLGNKSQIRFRALPRMLGSARVRRRKCIHSRQTPDPGCRVADIFASVALGQTQIDLLEGLNISSPDTTEKPGVSNFSPVSRSYQLGPFVRPSSRLSSSLDETNEHDHCCHCLFYEEFLRPPLSVGTPAGPGFEPSWERILHSGGKLS